MAETCHDETAEATRDYIISCIDIDSRIEHFFTPSTTINDLLRRWQADRGKSSNKIHVIYHTPPPTAAQQQQTTITQGYEPPCSPLRSFPLLSPPPTIQMLTQSFNREKDSPFISIEFAPLGYNSSLSANSCSLARLLPRFVVLLLSLKTQTNERWLAAELLPSSSDIKPSSAISTASFYPTSNPRISPHSTTKGWGLVLYIASTTTGQISPPPSFPSCGFIASSSPSKTSKRSRPPTQVTHFVVDSTLPSLLQGKLP